MDRRDPPQPCVRSNPNGVVAAGPSACAGAGAGDTGFTAKGAKIAKGAKEEKEGSEDDRCNPPSPFLCALGDLGVLGGDEESSMNRSAPPQACVRSNPNGVVAAGPSARAGAGAGDTGFTAEGAKIAKGAKEEKEGSEDDRCNPPSPFLCALGDLGVLGGETSMNRSAPPQACVRSNPNGVVAAGPTAGAGDTGFTAEGAKIAKGVKDEKEGSEDDRCNPSSPFL